MNDNTTIVLIQHNELWKILYMYSVSVKLAGNAYPTWQVNKDVMDLMTL